MSEYDGVYIQKNTGKFFVIKAYDQSRDIYFACSLERFKQTNTYILDERMSLSYISQWYIKNDVCKKLEVLHNIKERLNESNNIR